MKEKVSARSSKEKEEKMKEQANHFSRS